MKNSQSNQEAYDELAFYTLSHPDPAFIHQYIVDAYAAQYADEKTKPIQLIFALIGLYLHAEKSYSGKKIQDVHTQLGKKRRIWPKFSLPPYRGDISIFDVLAARPGHERDKAIHAWSISVWSAYQKDREAVIDLLRTVLI